jgi:predicted adenylyl cyclase CyaB
MPRNIEIKARVADMTALCRRVEAVTDTPPVVIHQSDTFFNCPHGRLKLRVIDRQSGELIYYQRPDMSGPSESSYSIFPVGDPSALHDILHRAYGTLGVVEKQRTLFLAGQTRIHLDQVAGLGDFMELEVVMGENQTPGEGAAIAQELMGRLEIEPASLVKRAYLDLLLGVHGCTVTGVAP